MSTHCAKIMGKAVVSIFSTLAVVCAFLPGGAWCSEAPEQQILEGFLRVIAAEDGESYFESYFAIDAGKEIEAPSDAGGARRARILQIAGLDEGMVEKAAQLVGKRVTVVGRPFGAFTVHHRTDVLWLATGMEESRGSRTP